MQFPADLEQPAFEMDRFVNLRELCATVTTEVAGAVNSLTIRFAKMVARIWARDPEMAAKDPL